MVELQEMIDEVDKNQTGQITFEGFKIIMTKTIKDEFTQNSAFDAFAVFDKQKTGKISRSELINILKNKGDQSLDDREINDLLSTITFDNNNEADYNEIVLSTFALFK